MSNSTKRILVIEPCLKLFNSWLTHIGPIKQPLDIHIVQTAEKARRILMREGVFHLIVTGHSLTEKEEIGTVRLIQELTLKRTRIPILAHSFISSKVEELKLAGATHSCDSYEVPKHITAILRPAS